MPKGLAAGTFIALTVSSTLTRFAVPILADHLGSKGVMGVCFFLQVAPVGLLFFADSAWMFYLFAILFGIGFGGEMTAFPIINRPVLRQRSDRYHLWFPDDGRRLPAWRVEPPLEACCGMQQKASPIRHL